MYANELHQWRHPNLLGRFAGDQQHARLRGDEHLPQLDHPALAAWP